jgi:hypothetical protein
MMKHPKHDPRYKLLPAAIEETLKLYHAWLGYLLTLIKADTIRVNASDITKALDSFTCTVSREGDEYVIRLDKGEEA